LWTDEAMSGAGFAGAWSELPVSYRLPMAAMEQACKFAESFLPGEQTALPTRQQQDLELEPCSLRWVQIQEHNAPQICCEEVLRLFSESTLQNMAISDATFLCAGRKLGLSVIKLLEKSGVKVVHTYDDDDKESRRQKVGFYMGDARVKATTLHSFKGWESRILVLYIGGRLDKKNLALIYAGLTRLKRNLNGSCLTVVSSTPELEQYGRDWPCFVSV